MQDMPAGYKPLALEPMVRPLDYDKLYEGRVVLYKESRRVTGKNGKPYDYHIIANDAGVERGLWGSAMLSALLRKAGPGSRLFIRYEGKQPGDRGNQEHTWTVAVQAEGTAAAASSTDELPF